MMKTILKTIIFCAIMGVAFISCEEKEDQIATNEDQNLIAFELDDKNLIGAAAVTPFNTGYYGPYQSYKMPQGQEFIEWSVTNLKWFFGVNPTVYNWQGANTNNMYAYSNPMRVFIGETWWNSMLNNYDAYTAKSIIAHEFGHILQFSNNWYWASGKNKEIGADFFAGYWLASDVGQAITWSQASNAFTNFYNIGSPAGGSHGSKTERQAAAKLGFYTGYYANSKGFLGWDKVYNLLSRYWYLIGQGNYYYDISGYKTQHPELYKGLSEQEEDFMNHLMSHFNEIQKIAKGEGTSKEYKKFVETTK
ncbi:hypothetical protein [Aquimarina megaterium]|uniref:hypothetical protein n=1 Tax=Aquimarina megaterium TaxID=1443666 RepID=UPI001111AA69|nr:hypothetical protein [Aquimarina megaterium]